MTALDVLPSRTRRLEAALALMPQLDDADALRRWATGGGVELLTESACLPHELLGPLHSYDDALMRLRKARQARRESGTTAARAHAQTAARAASQSDADALVAYERARQSLSSQLDELTAHKRRREHSSALMLAIATAGKPRPEGSDNHPAGREIESENVEQVHFREPAVVAEPTSTQRKLPWR